MDYSLNLPGLAEAIAQAEVSARHRDLVEACRQFPELADTKLAACRGNRTLAKRKVLTAAGDLVHEDHVVWLKSECEKDGGNAAATWERLKDQQLQVTECELAVIYLVHDRGGPDQNFVQLEVFVEDEFIDRLLLGNDEWCRPQDLDDLCSGSSRGRAYAGWERRRYRPSQYRLARAIDVQAFMEEAERVEVQRRVDQARLVVEVTDSAPGSVPERMTWAQAFPEGAGPWSYLRIFSDWSRSSAGRGGARLCDHWVLEIFDHEHPAIGRSIGFVPAWTHLGELKRVERPPTTPAHLAKRLKALDRRVGVPFGWYFFMLHGNLLKDWVGRDMLHAVDAGIVTLAAHDIDVLRGWAARPYGF